LGGQLTVFALPDGWDSSKVTGSIATWLKTGRQLMVRLTDSSMAPVRATSIKMIWSNVANTSASKRPLTPHHEVAIRLRARAGVDARSNPGRGSARSAAPECPRPKALTRAEASKRRGSAGKRRHLQRSAANRRESAAKSLMAAAKNVQPYSAGAADDRWASRGANRLDATRTCQLPAMPNGCLITDSLALPNNGLPCRRKQIRHHESSDIIGILVRGARSRLRLRWNRLLRNQDDQTVMRPPVAEENWGSWIACFDADWRWSGPKSALPLESRHPRFLMARSATRPPTKGTKASHSDCFGHLEGDNGRTWNSPDRGPGPHWHFHSTDDACRCEHDLKVRARLQTEAVFIARSVCPVVWVVWG